MEAKQIAGRQGVKQGWQQLLEVEETNDSLLFERMGSVIRLPQVVRQEVQAVTDDPEIFIDKLASVEAAFEIGLKPSATWEKLLERVDTGAIEQLRHAGSLLAREVPESECDGSEVAQLHEAVRGIFDELAAGGLDKEIRDFLLPHVIALDSALNTVKANGCAGIGYAATAAVGQWVLTPIQPPPEDSKTRKIWHRFWAATGKALRYAGIAGAAIQGIAGGVDILAELPLWDHPQLGPGDVADTPRGE